MSKFVDSILGHAVGDAMGVPTEFCSREHLLENPVVDMIESKKMGQPAGSWSDDTSMEIATIDSFIQKKKFDYDDIMTKWEEWINNAKYTANDDTFDVGRTCLCAIKKHSLGTDPLECGMDDEQSNGNGSLMRILPVALYSYYKKLKKYEIIKLTNEVSSLTHAHDISKLGCYIYVRYIMFLLDGKNKYDAYKLLQNEDYSSYDKYSIAFYDRILNDDISKYKVDDISSKGFVVDTLECALWIFLNSKSYKETIIASTNIGNDTDTIGAIAGSMAGIVYGINSIPEEWLNKLKRREYLIDLAINFEQLICTFKKDIIIGTAIGDIVGSIYEINDCKAKKNFELFKPVNRFTDDTVMTFAVAKTLTNFSSFKELKNGVVNNMVDVGLRYPKCGYGPSFYKWLNEEHKPYKSYGNGSVMRISSVPAYFNNEKDIKKACKIITDVSHNCKESELSAESICMAIYLAKNNKSKNEIREYIEKHYYKMEDSLAELQKSNEKVVIKSIDTARVALVCFFESYNFEDAIRNAISIGGDSDTIAAVTGGIAAAYYGIPLDIYEKGLSYLDEHLLNIHRDFVENYEL